MEITNRQLMYTMAVFAVLNAVAAAHSFLEGDARWASIHTIATAISIYLTYDMYIVESMARVVETEKTDRPDE